MLTRFISVLVFVVILLLFYCLLARSLLVLSLFVTCSFFMCLTADSPADLADYADECSRAALFRRQKTVSANESAKADAADNAEKDSYHIVECCSCLYNKSVREHACSFLVLSLLFPYVFNGRSHGNKGN